MRRHPEILHFETQHHVGVGDTAAVQRMQRRKVHAEMAILHRRLQGLGKFHQQPNSLRCPRRASRDDHRIFRRHQHLGRFGHRSGIARRRRGQRQLRNARVAPVRFGHGLFLQHRVGHNHHRLIRRRHRDLVSAHRGFGEVAQRNRIVVPLREVAHHGGGVLHAVRPLHVAAPVVHVLDVAENNVHRHAVRVGVVDRHRRVLQADGAVRQHHQRLAFDLEVAVRHRHRRFFVAAGDQLRSLVAAVVDQRFVQPAEAGPGIRADVIEVQAS